MILDWGTRIKPSFPDKKPVVKLGAGSLIIVDRENPDGIFYIIRSHSDPHSAWPLLDQAMTALEELSEFSTELPLAEDFVFWANARHQAEGITEKEIKYRYKGKHPAWITRATNKHHAKFLGSIFDEHLYLVDLSRGKLQWLR